MALVWCCRMTILYYSYGINTYSTVIYTFSSRFYCAFWSGSIEREWTRWFAGQLISLGGTSALGAMWRIGTWMCSSFAVVFDATMTFLCGGGSGRRGGTCTDACLVIESRVRCGRTCFVRWNSTSKRGNGSRNHIRVVIYQQIVGVNSLNPETDVSWSFHRAKHCLYEFMWKRYQTLGLGEELKEEDFFCFVLFWM